MFFLVFVRFLVDRMLCVLLVSGMCSVMKLVCVSRLFSFIFLMFILLVFFFDRNGLNVIIFIFRLSV